MNRGNAQIEALSTDASAPRMPLRAPTSVRPTPARPASVPCGSFRALVAPLLGMSALWPLLRYPSFAMILYPAASDESFSSMHIGLLVLLAVVTLVALGRGHRAISLAGRHPASVVVVGACCSLAALAAVASGSGALPAQAAWATVPFVAIGLVALYAAWASWCVCGYCMRTVCVVCGSFFLSFLFFSHSVSVLGVPFRQLACIVMPALSALLWWAARPRLSVADAAPAQPQRAAMNPFILLVGMFLLVGAVVRGVADLHPGGAAVRLGMSLVVAGLMTVCALVWALVGDRRAADAARMGLLARYTPMLSFALCLLMALTLLFIGVLFGFFLTGTGDFVVVVRSSMELVLWLLLCSLASAREPVSVSSFMALGMGVEIVSWFLSYMLVPAANASAGALSNEMLVLAVMFALAGVCIVAFMVAFVFTGHRSLGEMVPAYLDASLQGEPSPSAGRDVPASDPAAESEVAGHLDELAEDAQLTARERTVVELYSQGYSLAKVAEHLGITRATAQSHIKAAYRKLDVHTRDELIDLLRG